MQSIENKIIIYDDVCPMCQAYTAGFVRFGLLQARSGFAEASPEMLQKLDLNRARHEIPLLDTQTGETRYGLDALFYLLSARFPWMQPIFRLRLVRVLLYGLYQIITYNRRIIAGSRAPKHGFDCAPDANPFFQGLYISIALTGAGALLGSYAQGQELFWLTFAALQIGALLFTVVSRQKFIWLGHWATVLLVVAMLLRMFPEAIEIQLFILILSVWMLVKRWHL
jgi:predicted DCC family thiol-disulfide oxidoreductase YuxK